MREWEGGRKVYDAETFDGVHCLGGGSGQRGSEVLAVTSMWLYPDTGRHRFYVSLIFARGGTSPGWPVVAGAGWLNFNFPILDSN